MAENKTGIMYPKGNSNDLMSKLRLAFGPHKGHQPTLEERLQVLTPEKLHFVIQTARMVKMAHSYYDKLSSHRGV